MAGGQAERLPSLAMADPELDQAGTTASMRRKAAGDGVTGSRFSGISASEQAVASRGLVGRNV